MLQIKVQKYLTSIYRGRIKTLKELKWFKCKIVGIIKETGGKTNNITKGIFCTKKLHSSAKGSTNFE